MEGRVPNFYQILGVAQAASDADIKAAWRRLAHQHHPDKNPGNEEEANRNFLLVQMAWECLSDAKKRDAYDKQLDEGRRRANMGGPATRSEDQKKLDAALVRAVAKGNLRLAEKLLGQGALARSLSPKGTPALVIATRLGRFDLAMLLLVWGADPNAKDENGETPLHAAANASDYVGFVDLLLSNGALATVVNGKGQTALHQAATKGKSEAMKMVLQAGADLLGRDEDGRTALHHAVLGGSQSTVDLLLKAGARPTVCDKSGKTPLALARERGMENMELFLMSQGARD